MYIKPFKLVPYITRFLLILQPRSKYVEFQRFRFAIRSLKAYDRYDIVGSTGARVILSQLLQLGELRLMYS